MRFSISCLNKIVKNSKVIALAMTAPLMLGIPANAITNSHQLPDIGTAGLSALSLEKERSVGKQAMRQIRATYPMLHDPALQEYLETLGYKLISKGSTPIHPFTFFLINESSINAFAFFGGHVGVHTGLFMAAETESELASVLAHEIAHVNQRHLARHIEQQMRAKPVTVGATLGAILLTVLAPQAGIAALQTSMAAAQQMSINFTRKHEAEADRIGMQTLVSAGFDPHGMPDFFNKLASQYRFATKPPAFLLTHPLPETRVADAQLRAQQYPRRHTVNPPDFNFAKARVLARFSKLKPKEIVTQFKSQLKTEPRSQHEMLTYGLALAYLAADEVELAQITLAPLLTKYPRNLFVIDAITDIEIEANQLKSAATRLADFYQYMPENQVIALNYANVLLKQKKAEQSIKVIKTYLISSPDDLTALGLLEDAYAQANMIGPQYEVRANSLALMGHFQQAIAMLERALSATSNQKHIEVAKLEAKKRLYQQEFKAMKASR